MSRRDRQRRPARRAAFRDPKPLLLIVCEGERTEPQYLRGLVSACRNPRVRIEIAPELGDPKYVVNAAKDHKQRAESESHREGDEKLLYDQVWCVFDIDDHERVPDALQMARDNKIELAISNPCFELWLLLHFRESPGMISRAKLPGLLGKHLSGYSSKQKHVTFTDFASGVDAATARAEKLDDLAKQAGTPGHNPTTGVYRLVESIASS